MPNLCMVCEQQASAGAGLNRVGGADVCDRCFLGEAPQRIRARGWSFQIRQWDRVINDHGDRLYYTAAILVMPSQAQIHLRCRRKTLMWKILGLVMPGIKGGDGLFDGRVRVASDTPRAARTLICDDGVQSILLDMLGEGSSVTVSNGSIDVYSCRDEYVPEPRFSSEMCVLASHFIRLQGSP